MYIYTHMFVSVCVCVYYTNGGVDVLSPSSCIPEDTPTSKSLAPKAKQ